MHQLITANKQDDETKRLKAKIAEAMDQLATLTSTLAKAMGTAGGASQIAASTSGHPQLKAAIAAVSAVEQPMKQQQQQQQQPQNSFDYRLHNDDDDDDDDDGLQMQ